MSTPAAIDIFDRWLYVNTMKVSKHVLRVCTEQPGSQTKIIKDLREIVRSHYVAPEITSKRLAELGAPQTAELLKGHLPTTKTARSGDLGEILATEIAERTMRFRVPIRRLRWKDGREMALRGDDIIAFHQDPKGNFVFLKGESKSRVSLSSTVVEEAADALDRDRGRPSRHSMLFIAERLRELGEDALAIDFEKTVLGGFRGCAIEHFLFTMSENNPHSPLSNHINTCTSKMPRHAVGLRISGHVNFIKRVFSGI